MQLNAERLKAKKLEKKKKKRKKEMGLSAMLLVHFLKK